jgi:hypothetical protein
MVATTTEPRPPGGSLLLARPETKYAKTADGVHIA